MAALQVLVYINALITAGIAVQKREIQASCTIQTNWKIIEIMVGKTKINEKKRP